MRRLRPLRSGAATVIVGALFGYVGAALVAPSVADHPLFGGTGESPIARRYMIALIEADTATMHRLLRPTDVASRATAYTQALGNPSSGRAEALTYLGGGAQGPLSVFSYVITFVSSTGDKGLIPVSLSIVDDKVVRIE